MLKHPPLSSPNTHVSLELGIRKVAIVTAALYPYAQETTSFFILSPICKGEPQVFEIGPDPVISLASCEHPVVKAALFLSSVYNVRLIWLQGVDPC